MKQRILRWWYLARFTEARRRLLYFKEQAVRSEMAMCVAWSQAENLPKSPENDALVRVMNELASPILRLK